MKIRNKSIAFANKTVQLTEASASCQHMDYIVSLVIDLVTASLQHLNIPDLWEEDPTVVSVPLTTETGEELNLSIINIDNNRVQVLLNEEVMEEDDELHFATEFLSNVRNHMDELLTEYKDNKPIYSQMKADLRSDLNHLELAIDRY